MRVLLWFLMISTLAGCAQIDASKCENYGYQPGTSNYSACLMTLDQNRRGRMLSTGISMMAQPAPAAPVSRPVQTVCNPPMGPNMPMTCTTQ